jgi:hypothetical protein
MYFAVIEASPKRGTEAFTLYEGAHVACWVNTTDYKSGRERAVALVNQSGWFVKRVREEKILCGADYEPTHDGLERFNQALIDGEVCVIYTFPHPHPT